MNEALNEFLKTADPLCAEHDSIVDQLDIVTSDRDIKAANLQLLVEDVLAYDEACLRCERNGNDGGDVHEAVETWKHLVDLARSLKQ